MDERDALLDRLTDAFFAVDREWRLTVVNRAARELLRGAGRTDEAIVGKFIGDVVEPAEHEGFRGRYAEAMASQKPMVFEEFYPPLQRWFETRVYPSPEGFSVFLADVTARRAAEAALAAERDRLGVTLASLAEGVVATDRKDRIERMNEAAAKLLGVPAEAAVGRPLGEVVRLLDERTREPVAAGRATTALILHPDGGERTVSVSGAPIRGEEGGRVLVLRDLTASRRMEAELGRARRLESLGFLAAGLAHDFNNLLTGVVANVALARRAGVSESAEQRLAAADAACDRARELTERLLTFARGGAPRKASIDVGPLLRDHARLAVHGRAVRLVLEVADPLPPVEADPAQLGQVVHNLVVNAAQASPEGAVVTVRAWAEGDEVVLAVVDEGGGIPPEALPHVFDPFFTTRAEGTGLGLATSWSIVRRHEGRIDVDSGPTGTTFTVRLPASPQAPAATSARRATPGGRVLVMDDDPPVRDVLARSLRILGYAPETTADGNAAVAAYRAALEAGDPFRSVILDLVVPGGAGGLEALAGIRALDPRAHVLVASGYSDDPVLADPIAYGFDGVLKKPFGLDDLSTALATLAR